ncbi:uncharacterized protein LOC111040601, partial [Myzus persicae]|uniref:uncharacterized protein LOC111040601 n=1 Tax=Myzus persicae TaxID=13164 RepID=UPI000B934E1F
MPPKKETISKDEFNAFKNEVERNSRYLVDQLLQKINQLEEKCSNMEDESSRKIEKIMEDHCRDMQNLEQQNKTDLENLRKIFVEQKRDVSTIYEDRKNSNIEISKPTFFGNNKDQHPIDFLQNLEEYFKVKQINNEEKLLVIRDCLRNTAGNWYATIRFQIREYPQFRDAFIDEFWSREIQIKTWSSCLNISQVPNNITYREHFAQWSTKLRHLQVPQISEEEIVTNIASHYPGYLRAILISLPEKSIISAMKILSAEEHCREKAEPPVAENSNNNQQKSNNWNNQRNNGWNSMPSRHNRWNNQPYRNNDKRGETQQSNPQQTEKIHQVSTSNEEQAGHIDKEQHVINSLKTTNQSISPYIRCTIEGEEVTLLVDTGATISVLTKEVVDIITQKNPKIPQLPVTGIQISNAVGKKICKVSKQIFCECKIGNIYMQTDFIQVENLNEKGIIGADILRKYSAQIKFSEQTVQFKIDKITHTIPFASQKPRLIDSKEHILNVEIHENPEDNQITLTNDEKQMFVSLLNKYEGIFSNQPGKIQEFQCQIRVKPGDPIHQRQYPIPISRIPRVDAEIQRMLTLGIIEKSTSPWSSPIVCIEKKNGELRLCLDARKINTVIIPDRECPTNLEETLMKFQGMKYLSSIDLTAGYWQCPLRKDCREITAFLHRGRNYQFR